MKWLCILAFATSTALAQTYPAKPVRVIVPFPPGGTADLLTRTTAQKLSASLGQQFVVESRAGAGGNLGAPSRTATRCSPRRRICSPSIPCSTSSPSIR